MRKPNLITKAILAVSAAVVGIALSTAVASAIPYDSGNTQNSPVPAFNVFTGVPTAGNESDFLRARVPTAPSGDTSTQYVDPLSATCTIGQRIQMRVYIHNGASESGNQGGNGPSVAHGTKVKVDLPTNQGSSFKANATISSTNAGTVNDDVSINCNGKNVKLKYIPGSASQFSTGTGAIALSDSLLTSGVAVRSQANAPAGDVWGCWNDRVYVILAVEVVEEEAPQVTATCDMFTITASDNRRVRVSQFQHTATNAAFKKAVINWGDNTTEEITDASAVVNKTHQYAKDGTYQVTATVTFGVNGKPDIVAGGPNTACAKQVVFSADTPPVVTPPNTPPAPGKLVNTGPGAVAAVFGATSAAGAVAYRWALGRRLG